MKDGDKRSELDSALDALENDEFEDELEMSDTDDDSDSDTDTDIDTDSDTDSDTDVDTDTDTDTDDDAVSELKAEIMELKNTMAAMAKGEPPKVKAEDIPEFGTVEYEAQDFVPDDFDPDELTGTSLNEMLNKVAETAFKKGGEMLYKKILTNIPGLVKNSVATQSTIQTAVNEFYSENPDLKKFQGAVRAVAEELASKNPTWSVDKLFKKAGDETRKRLGLKKRAKSASDKSDTTPPKVGPRGQKSRKKAKKSGLEGEIDSMIDATEPSM